MKSTPFPNSCSNKAISNDRILGGNEARRLGEGIDRGIECGARNERETRSPLSLHPAPQKATQIADRLNFRLWVATESCCQISQFGSHYLELPSHDSLLDSDYCPLSKASLGFLLRYMKTTSLSSLGCCETDNRIGVKVRWSKGLDMKLSLYMA